MIQVCTLFPAAVRKSGERYKIIPHKSGRCLEPAYEFLRQESAPHLPETDEKLFLLYDRKHLPAKTKAPYENHDNGIEIPAFFGYAVWKILKIFFEIAGFFVGIHMFLLKTALFAMFMTLYGYYNIKVSDTRKSNIENILIIREKNLVFWNVKVISNWRKGLYGIL